MWSRGVASEAERGSRAEGGVRSPNAGTEEVVHLSCLGRETGEDAGSAGGEVCAHDLKRPGVQRAHRLNPLPRIMAATRNDSGLVLSSSQIMSTNPKAETKKRSSGEDA